MHEQPQGFPGFRVSPAAFFLDGIRHNRTTPDWMHTHEKSQRERQWQETASARADHDEAEGRQRYAASRTAALEVFFASPEGREKYGQVYPLLLTFYRLREPERAERAAHEATVARLERLEFHFQTYEEWRFLQQCR